MAFASGEVSTTYSSAQRVLTDYPFSRVRPQAAYWAGRAQIDLGNLVSACRLLNQAADSAGEDVELANRARFYVQRCASVPPVRPDSAAKDSVAPAAVSTSRTGRPASSPGAYAIQVAAVRSAAAADQSMQMLRRAGYDPRVSRDPDGLFKVRVGRYKTRPEAQRVGTEIHRKLNLAPFVVEEP
jgi:cell division septation protein DedD